MCTVIKSISVTGDSRTQAQKPPLGPRFPHCETLVSHIDNLQAISGAGCISNANVFLVFGEGFV
jgi:hypothetical protein